MRTAGQQLQMGNKQFRLGWSPFCAEKIELFSILPLRDVSVK